MEKNPDLERLQKLKAAIKKDVEKKQGRKISDKTPEKKRITLSQDLKKRLSDSKSLNIDLEKIKTLVDIERYYSDIQNYELVEYIKKHLNDLNDSFSQSNLEGIIALLESDFENAKKIYVNLLSEKPTDYCFYNLLDAMMMNGDSLDKLLVEFVKGFQKSPYPYIISLKLALTDSKRFMNIAKVMGIGLKMSKSEDLQLFQAMLNMNFSNIIKVSGVLYRKNLFKEFQNINRFLAYKMEKDSSTLRMNLDNLSKRDTGFCMSQYLKLISTDNKTSSSFHLECPVSVFNEAKTFLVNGDEGRARILAETLDKKGDPYGKLITASILFSENYYSAAYNIWFDIIKTYPSTLVLWYRKAKAPVKGLGIDNGILDANVEKLPVFSSLENFQTYMEKKLEVYGDFEINLYPFEELRCFFGYRFCTQYYKMGE